MAEVLARYSHRISDREAAFLAQACGAPMRDGRWAAWIEFIPLDGGEPLRSPRETIQPNWTDVQYWAAGLTPVYLEGALRRARNPPVRESTERLEPLEPMFSAPADMADDGSPPAEAVLDPLSIYLKDERLLRQQLRALSSPHLVNIIRAYGLSEEPAAALRELSAPALIGRIVAGCQRLSRVRSRGDRTTSG